MVTTQGSGAGGTQDGSNSSGSGTSQGVSQESGNTATAGQAQAANQGQQQQGSGFDATAILTRLDSLDNELKESRRENQNLRKRLKAAAGDDESSGAGTGTNTVPPEVSEALAKMKAGRAKDQIRAAALEAKAQDPANLWRLVESLDDVTDDEGNVKNPVKLMADMRKAYPFAFKPVVDGPVDGGGGSTSGNPQDMNAILRNGFRRLRGDAAGG